MLSKASGAISILFMEISLDRFIEKAMREGEFQDPLGKGPIVFLRSWVSLYCGQVLLGGPAVPVGSEPQIAVDGKL